MTLHELKIKRDCPLLKGKTNLKQVIDLLPDDVEIIGVLMQDDDKQFKIIFGAPSLGEMGKSFRVATKLTLEETTPFGPTK